MAREESADSSKTDRESREERLGRLRRLLQERGEDAAKMVRTWLQRGQEGRRR